MRHAPIEVLLVGGDGPLASFLERICQDIDRPPVLRCTPHSLDTALKALDGSLPQACILMLPLSGSPSPKQARWRRLFQAVPTIIVTEGTDPGLLELLLESGVHDWVARDALEPEILGAMVRHAMERHTLRAELELRRQVHETVLDTVPDVIAVIDRHGRLMSWNRKLERVSGYSSRQLSKKQLWDLVPPSVSSSARPVFARAFGPGAKEGSADLLTRAGQSIRHRWSSEPIKDAAGHVIGVLVTARATPAAPPRTRKAGPRAPRA